MMKSGEFKILYLIIAVFVALGLFLGSYNLYQKYVVEQPLVEKLSRMEEVQNVEITKKEKLYFIQVHLARVENIQESYTDIDSTINSVLKQGNYEIDIEDKSNQKLDQLFDELQPSIYQGLAQKQYLWLDNQIKQRSQEQGITARLWVDEERVYLQMNEGSSYLYSIINNLETGAQETGRGGVN